MNDTRAHSNLERSPETICRTGVINFHPDRKPPRIVFVFWRSKGPKIKKDARPLCLPVLEQMKPFVVTAAVIARSAFFFVRREIIVPAIDGKRPVASAIKRARAAHFRQYVPPVCLSTPRPRRQQNQE